MEKEEDICGGSIRFIKSAEDVRSIWNPESLRLAPDLEAAYDRMREEFPQFQNMRNFSKQYEYYGQLNIELDTREVDEMDITSLLPIPNSKGYILQEHTWETNRMEMHGSKLWRPC